jgi:hypothetical protein
MGLPLLTNTTTADHQTRPTLHLPLDHHGPLGHRNNRPRLCQERQKPDRLPIAGGIVRSRDVPWLSLLDFFSSSILAGGFSELLAYGIANMAGVGGYNGWSWIFIL